MRIAGGELRPGIADPDDGASVKGVGGHALVLHPAPVHHRVPALAAEPGLRTQGLCLLGHLRSFLLGFAEPAEASLSARVTSDSASSMSRRMAFSAARASCALTASSTARCSGIAWLWPRGLSRDSRKVKASAVSTTTPRARGKLLSTALSMVWWNRTSGPMKRRLS